MLSGPEVFTPRLTNKQGTPSTIMDFKIMKRKVNVNVDLV